jgi:hypothetical protein
MLYKDGNQQGGDQAGARRNMGFHVQKAKTHQHDHDRNGSQQRGNPHVAHRVIDLLPNHD